MQITKLSSKGQVIIPKALRTRYNWNIGEKSSVIDTGEEILLKAFLPFKSTELGQVAGMLKHTGKKVTIAQMEEAVKKGALEHK